jgi:hypothetical protein
MNVVRPESGGGVAVIVHVGEPATRSTPAFEVGLPAQRLSEEVGA